ncbi:MAG: leucine dehydrogenase [Ignavibacteria bacterium]|nr:leucine dehydrogenase [Ignavibacteria bacterium]
MNEKENLLSLSISDFIQRLIVEKINKFYFVFDDKKKKLIASHQSLQPIADFFSKDKRDFIIHEGWFCKISDQFNMLLGAFVHRTNRGQAAGGIRYWNYDTIEDYFRDGLRLATGMTFKNALAGLWWGGGKGVIAHNSQHDKSDPKIREKIYSEYGAFMSSLNGCYVTAEDVGTSVEDMANVFSNTRFTTCIPLEFGGSGNPSVPTAKGVICGIEAALDFLHMGTLENKTIAIQGLGHVGKPLVEFLLEKRVKKIVGTDINLTNIKNLEKNFGGKNLECRLVDKNDISIFSEECDIFSPNATGAIINEETIPLLKAKIVCGAANNQLEDTPRDGKILLEKEIAYVPDFLTNRMGIVTCANEQYGYINNDPLIESHFSNELEHSIYNRAMQVLNESKNENKPASEIALQLANKLSKENHPIFGHRGKEIIKSLVENKWHLH